MGGYPAIDPGSPCPDADRDGLPDAWEQRYFSSPTAANISDDPDGEGYTNIEEYLNGTDPRVASIIPPPPVTTPHGPTPPGGLGICQPPPFTLPEGPQALPPDQVKQGPTADFDCTINGNTVICTDSSVPGKNPQTGDTEPITYWGWRWGDGTTLPNQFSGGTVTHTYLHPDKYVIRLTVIDNLGRANFKQIEVDLVNQTATEGVQSPFVVRILLDIFSGLLPSSFPFAPTIPGLLDAFISFLLILATPILVFLIIAAGIMLMFSGANPELQRKAMRLVNYGILGYAIILIARVLLGVVSGVLF